ncbi:hypothetical protein D9758_014336 [Tetrapyrgos nigripes]|uniref:E2 ubiquitin-conjugating enzyme n=1 Tax=Tetrapyrgos nigripes TaxID=182062 RepID=A0A8H5CA03_9AGAR|nr:hypothetical protein D9758_014336 [Tetrapyrgos nigripes]
MSVNQAAMRRIVREVTNLKKNPPEGIRVQTSEENIYDITGIIEGPEGTPYAGGYFRVKFRFTEEFPAAPPRCTLITKIFHPNVSSSGEICVNTLKKDWKSTYGIEHILVTVKCLLIYPNPESALDEEAGKLLLENYESYCSRAKLITSVHATPRVRPVEFDTPSVSSSKSTTPESKSTLASEASGSGSASITAVSTSTSITSPAVSKPPSKTSSSSLPSTASFTLPIVTTSTRKSASPAPTTVSIPLTSSPKNLGVEKDGSNGTGPVSINKDRHPSPSPLGTADSNVASTKPVVPATGAKAVKRAATGAASTVAEKRKKALKRL